MKRFIMSEELPVELMKTQPCVAVAMPESFGGGAIQG